jgi:hypothetical protein
VIELLDPVDHGLHISYLARGNFDNVVMRFQKNADREKARKLIGDVGDPELITSVPKQTVRAIIDSSFAFSNQNAELNLLPQLWSLSTVRKIGDGSRSLFYFDAPASEIEKVAEKRLFIDFSRPSFWSRPRPKARR